MIVAEVLTERVDAVNAYERNLRGCIREMLKEQLRQFKKAGIIRDVKYLEKQAAADGACCALLELADNMGIEL